MDSWTLRREELDQMVERLAHAEFTNDEDVDEARWLRTYIGKTGFVQLGFAHQGIMMVYEASTDWYDHYQRLLELSEDFGGIPIDEPDQDEETDPTIDSGGGLASRQFRPSESSAIRIVIIVSSQQNPEVFHSCAGI